MDSLQGDTIEGHEKRKMMEILKRFEKEEAEESLEDEGFVPGENLEERLEGLNLDRDTEKIWEKLTTDEQREFQQAVDDGFIGSLINTWIPWWITRDSSRWVICCSQRCPKEEMSNTPSPCPDIL